MNKGIKLLLILLGFALITACDHTIKQKEPEKKEDTIVQPKIRDEVDKVVLEISNKENITAGELVQKDIRASGYDPSYAIKYEKIEGNSSAREAKITFFLKKDGIESKRRMEIVKGFKADEGIISEKEKINSEVDKLVLEVPTKAQITAEELKNEHIKASNYDLTLYEVSYKTIKQDIVKKEAYITVFLKKKGDILTSKEKTVTITGFKEKFLPPDTIEIAEKTLLALFDLTETKITASAAAKKIVAAQTTTVDGFEFEEATAVAYDDEKGTFTVKVKGSKEGKIFDKTFNISGFTHPYASAPETPQSCSFKSFDEEIENNLSIEKYIEKVNANIKEYLTFSFKLKNLKIIALNEVHNDYKLTAAVSNDGGELKINPNYILIYKKLAAGGSAEITEEKSYTTLSNAFRNQKKPYFTAENVFKYVLGKTNGNFIKADSSKFASSIYALAKTTAAASAGLFDIAQIQTYVDRYKMKDEGEHLKLDIQAGIYNPKNAGLRANDVDGSLTVQYCLATTEQLEHQINDSHPGSPAIEAISKETTVIGFKKADKNTLQDLFAFKILKQGTCTDEEAKKEWKGYSISGTPAGTYMLFSGENGVYSEVFPFPNSLNNKPFRITINDSDNPGTVFADVNPPYLSGDLNSVKILLNGVVLTKKYGDELLKVTFTLSNNDTVDVEYAPLF